MDPSDAEVGAFWKIWRKDSYSTSSKCVGRLLLCNAYGRPGNPQRKTTIPDSPQLQKLGKGGDTAQTPDLFCKQGSALKIGPWKPVWLVPQPFHSNWLGQSIARHVLLSWTAP